MHNQGDLRRVHPFRAGRLAAGLAAAVLGTAAVATLYALAVKDPAGRAVDDAVMRAAMRAGAGVRAELLGLLGVVSVVTVAGALVVLTCVALVRGRPGRAVGIVAVVLGAQAVTQLLKAGLPRPEDGADNSLPSGHVTLVASLVVAAALALPAVLRPLVALLGTGVVAAAGVATMIVGWHRPSDVAAAVAVVVAVTGVVAAASALLPGRPATDVDERAARREPAERPGVSRAGWPDAGRAGWPDAGRAGWPDAGRAGWPHPPHPASRPDAGLVVTRAAPTYRPTVPDLRR